jgi:hypothetical protein
MPPVLRDFQENRESPAFGLFRFAAFSTAHELASILLSCVRRPARASFVPKLSSRASIRTRVSLSGARCILGPDSDESELLSKARPRRAKPLVAVIRTRDRYAFTITSGHCSLIAGQIRTQDQNPPYVGCWWSCRLGLGQLGESLKR